MLEVTFISIHEGFKIIMDEIYGETSGMIDKMKYKTTAFPTLAKALSDKRPIAADLEGRLNKLTDRRNELMQVRAIAQMMTRYMMRLCELVGMLLLQGRQVAIVLISDSMLLSAHRGVPHYTFAGIDIALVGGYGKVVDVSSLWGGKRYSSQVCAATEGWN